MNRLRVVITGQPLTAQRTRNNGRGGVYTPKEYRNWKKAAAWAIAAEAKGAKMNLPVRVTMSLYTETWRGDWDNFYKAALDAIVDAGIIPNDGRKCVRPPLPGVDTVDRANPRMELLIETIENFLTCSSCSKKDKTVHERECA